MKKMIKKLLIIIALFAPKESFGMFNKLEIVCSLAITIGSTGFSFYNNVIDRTNDSSKEKKIVYYLIAIGGAGFSAYHNMVDYVKNLYKEKFITCKNKEQRASDIVK